MSRDDSIYMIQQHCHRGHACGASVVAHVGYCRYHHAAKLYLTTRQPSQASFLTLTPNASLYPEGRRAYQ